MESLSSSLAEFEQFSEPEGTFSDMQFIENFPVTSSTSSSTATAGDTINAASAVTVDPLLV
eukprot:gene25605-32077_t